MKPTRMSLNLGGAVALAGLLCLGTSVAVGSVAQAATAKQAQKLGSGPIPARPEKLQFPPLQYEPPAPAEYRVQLKSGPVAYVVPDRTLPLVNIVVLVRVGKYLEPEGKEGLAELTGWLLARGGAGSRSAEELEERLAFLAAELDSSIGDTQGRIRLNLLSKDLDEGLGILRDVLVAPRFQDSKIALRKQQMLQEMQQRNDDAAYIEAREHAFLAFGEAFWANRLPTKASVESITPGDIKLFHRTWFWPSNFVLAVSGDFDRTVMVAKLEKLFDAWPFAWMGDFHVTYQPPPPIPTNAAFAAPGVYLVHKQINQGRVSILLPGIMRDDPDYFAALIMNDILGGGGFTSRIMNRVRSDEGLAYSARSTMPGGVYYALPFTASFQTKSRTVAFATSIVLEELRRMTAEHVTDHELATAKQGFIERFPRNFATKEQVALTFAQDEFTGRYAKDPEFWKLYRSRISAVTKEDVQRVAKRFLHPDRVAIIVVGDEPEILKGHPDHPVSLKSLAGGKYTRLPLRDPLTLKPIEDRPREMETK
ncbi:MAG: insulinase family protein [Verrucomicrobiae bacterium]|nr:insulinase family protein [Verrucomicrobiae bacterium]